MKTTRRVRLSPEQLETVMEERNRHLGRSTRATSKDPIVAQIAADRRRARGQRENAPVRDEWSAKLGISR